MSAIAIPPSRFVGCDVGKLAIVVFDTGAGQTRTIPNRKADLTRFARSLDDACFVVCEATGGYEARLLQAMLAAGRAAHRADARKVKAFIRSFGTLGKTDAIDARALARYGEERHRSLARWQEPDPIRLEIQELVLLRADLVRNRQAQRNRIAAPARHSATALACLRGLVRALQTQIAAIERHLHALIAQHPQLAADEAVLRGIKGIGPAVAATLLALMPELGSISGKQAASLAGVAPHPRQSGASDGYRPTRGGRAEVRPALFMAALVAARNHQALREVYKRLVANGKKPIVAVTALMRKIVVIANAKLRDARSQREVIQVS